MGAQYSKPELQEVKRFQRTSPKNFYDSPAVEIRLQRTLSLLKVALVVNRERLDQTVGQARAAGMEVKSQKSMDNDSVSSSGRG